MSNVFFVSDLHLGHLRAKDFPGRKDMGFATEWEHDEFICANWNSRVGKNDTVYVLGDVAFNTDALDRLEVLNGQKRLVRGNHDVFGSNRYLVYFDHIFGFVKLKYGGQRYWLSHCPIHPAELRGAINIHGHVHTNTIRNEDGEIDKRYWNVCIENIGWEPRTIAELAELFNRS